MKPTPQDPISPRSTGDQRPAHAPESFPKTHYRYQAATIDTVASPAGSPDATIAEARLFRNISRRFIEAGAGQEFRAEALFFGLIALTAAWQLVVSVHELSTMIIGIVNGL
jgi:hypothetical protein